MSTNQTVTIGRVVPAFATSVESPVVHIRKELQKALAYVNALELEVKQLRAQNKELQVDNAELETLLQQAAARKDNGGEIAARLSPRQRQVAYCVAVEGLKNKAVAVKLGTTEQVVKNYLRDIYDTVGVDDRLSLAVYALHSPSFTAGLKVPSTL